MQIGDVLVNLLIAVTNTRQEGNGREGDRAGMASSLQGYSPSEWESAQWQEQKAGHIAFAVEKQRKMNSEASRFLLCTQSRTQTMEWCQPHSWWLFSL